MIGMSAEVKGVKETEAKLQQVSDDLHGSPMEEGMRDATAIVLGTAKRYATVDTGRMRNSITPEVRNMGATIQGVVGSNVVYAPYQELGTRPHWPPIQALTVWASRHGTTAYNVAKGIAIHGTKAVRFLQRGFEENRSRIIDRLDKAAKEIVNK